MGERFPHNAGRCRWCTFKNRVLGRLGLRHPMLPTHVWHGEGSGWKWHGGFGRLLDSSLALTHFGITDEQVPDLLSAFDDASWPICDNCGKAQGEDEWFRSRDGHLWCSACNTVIHDHEQIRGTLMVTCPECGWHLTVKLSEGTASRDRDRPNQERPATARKRSRGPI